MEISKVSCLCLPEREENWLKLEQQIAERDWNYERCLAGPKDYNGPYQLDYIDDPNPDVSQWGYGGLGRKHHHYNAFMCHKQMLGRAKNEGCENLLIMEDDAYITSRFDKIWDKLNELVFHDGKFNWDIIYMGWWIGDEEDLFNETIEKEWNEESIIRLDKVKRVGGLHGALINNTMFDFLLDLRPTNPIDCILNYYHHKIKSYYICPKIIHTRSMMSICEGCIMKRNEL